MVDGVTILSLNGTETAGLVLNITISAGSYPSGSPNPKNTLACAVAAVADAVTKTFRNSAYYAAKGFDESSGGFVAGKAYTTTTFVRVKWYWISLPVAIWLIDIVA